VHKQGVGATQQLHHRQQPATLAVHVQLPAIIHELKRFSSRGDIGTNPSIIFHITRRSDR